jgi:hypothetical protein
MLRKPLSMAAVAAVRTPQGSSTTATARFRPALAVQPPCQQREQQRQPHHRPKARRRPPCRWHGPSRSVPRQSGAVRGSSRVPTSAPSRQVRHRAQASWRRPGRRRGRSGREQHAACQCREGTGTPESALLSSSTCKAVPPRIYASDAENKRSVQKSSTIPTNK